MRVLAVLFVAAMLPGCAVVYQDTSCVKIQERTRPSDPVVRTSPRDRSIGIVGGSPSDPRFGFARFPLRRWAAFRYELKAGSFTQPAIDVGDLVVLCTELDEFRTCGRRPSRDAVRAGSCGRGARRRRHRHAAQVLNEHGPRRQARGS